jgi:hypothetical protein
MKWLEIMISAATTPKQPMSCRVLLYVYKPTCSTLRDRNNNNNTTKMPTTKNQQPMLTRRWKTGSHTEQEEKFNFEKKKQMYIEMENPAQHDECNETLRGGKTIGSEVVFCFCFFSSWSEISLKTVWQAYTTFFSCWGEK